MFESARKWLAKTLAPTVQVSAQSGKRMYAGAQFNRLTADWAASSTSADSEILTSIRTLRNRGRQLIRDNEYARNAQRIIRNNVIGHKGIGFQAQVMMQRGGKLNEAVNSAIEYEWARWCRASSCSVNGKYSFLDIQRLVINALPSDGEILVRMVPQKFGTSRVPFGLEMIESDQLVDNLTTGRADNGNMIRMGVEVDKWLRPVQFHMFPYHPGDLNFVGQPAANRYLKVSADEIIHLGVAERPNQTRYVSWFAAALRRLNNMAGYEEAEIVAARASAAIMGFIETPEVGDGALGAVADATTGQRITDLAPGTLQELAPGETFNGFAPARPNAAMEPFMRFMLRGFGVGVGVSYAPLSGDYSQANYSSERAAQLNARDEWRALQTYLMEHFHQVVFEKWLEMAVLSGVLDLPGYYTNPEIYQAVVWQPRGWEWVDPLKDGMAQKMAVRAGFSSVTEVIAGKGGDVEEVFKTRRREIDLAKEYDLVLESDPAMVDEKGVVQGAAPPADGGDGGEGADGGAASGEGGAAATDGADAGAKLLAQLEDAMVRGNDELAERIIGRLDRLEAAQSVANGLL